MRKIARQAGFSPTAIYLYYPAKDALYLEILKDGFEILFRLLQTGTDPILPPLERIQRYTQTYLKFSQEYANYYDLMFSYPVPKYLDYVGTEMEYLAWEEKRIALQDLELLQTALREAQARQVLRADLEAVYMANTLLSLCHGMISLHRSHIWSELNTSLTELYHQAVENFLSGLMERRLSESHPIE